MLDIVVSGGKIIDGTGKPAFHGDIGISNEKIVEISSKISTPAEHVIDATNKIVAPGFIDVHSHSDLTLLVDPTAESKLRQGVTTEINGNCGFGVAPIPKENISEFIGFWKSSGSEWFDMNPEWHSFSEYLDVMEKSRPALNTSILAAHGTIRFVVMKDAPRKAGEEEISEMERIVDDCMKGGACGLSSGLRYTPSSYADSDELVRLCEVVRNYGGLYATHMRSEGDNGSWKEAVIEAVDVAKRASVPLQISHLKALSKNVWNTSGEILDMCQKFRAEGIDLTADQYPYDAAHTGLTVFLPTWVRLEELKSLGSEDLNRVLQHIRQVLDVRGGPTRIIIISSPRHVLDGKDIGQVSEELGSVDHGETILKLIMDYNGEISIISRSMNEEDIQKIMKASYVMISTDGYSISPGGPAARGIPHPRSYGTYPRILGRYARDLNVITLEDAIRKMTSLPAMKFLLKKRGIVEEEAYADLVVFDSSTVQDLSTFASPEKYPIGIEYVMVNGKVAIDRNKGHTGERPGKVLRLRNRSIT